MTKLYNFRYDSAELRVIADILDTLNKAVGKEFGPFDGALDIYWTDSIVGQILYDDEHGCWYYKAGGGDSDNP